MPKQSNGLAYVLDGPDIVVMMQMLVDVPVEKCGEGYIQKELVVV